MSLDLLGIFDMKLTKDYHEVFERDDYGGITRIELDWNQDCYYIRNEYNGSISADLYYYLDLYPTLIDAAIQSTEKFTERELYLDEEE